MMKSKTLNKNHSLTPISSCAQVLVYLGIGTNKGIREENINKAITLLRNIKEIKVLKLSKLLKNPPREGVRSGYFLNGAIKLLTSLSPDELLKVCKRIERKMGRQVSRIKRSRIIDLDILFYGDKIISSKCLTIPHPMIEKRDFVLIPLLDIAKDFKHPVVEKTVETLCVTSLLVHRT